MPDETPLSDMEITYRQVFNSSNNAEVVINDLIEKGGVLAVAPPTDGLKMAFLEGQRNIVLYILGMTGRVKLSDLEDLCQKP